MPTFRVKNLSVTLGEAGAPAAQQALQYCHFPTPYCLFPTDACRFPTIIVCWTGTLTCLTNSCGIFSPDPCGLHTDPCGAAWSTLPPTTFRTITPVIKTIGDAGVIELLQGQLEEAMAAVKERGVAIEEGLRPQSLEDVERLETELKAALDEVRAMKKDVK